MVTTFSSCVTSDNYLSSLRFSFFICKIKIILQCPYSNVHKQNNSIDNSYSSTLERRECYRGDSPRKHTVQWNGYNPQHLYRKLKMSCFKVHQHRLTSKYTLKCNSVKKKSALDKFGTIPMNFLIMIWLNQQIKCRVSRILDWIFFQANLHTYFLNISKYLKGIQEHCTWAYTLL